MAVHPGPWAIRSDVAWSGEDEIYVLPLRPPYAALPWALSGTAALIWRSLADGCTFLEIVATFEDADPGQVAAGVTDFVAELTRRDLLAPLSIAPVPIEAGSQ